MEMEKFNSLWQGSDFTSVYSAKNTISCYNKEISKEIETLMYTFFSME